MPTEFLASSAIILISSGRTKPSLSANPSHVAERKVRLRSTRSARFEFSKIDAIEFLHFSADALVATRTTLRESNAVKWTAQKIISTRQSRGRMLKKSTASWAMTISTKLRPLSDSYIRSTYTSEKKWLWAPPRLTLSLQSSWLSRLGLNETRVPCRRKKTDRRFTIMKKRGIILVVALLILGLISSTGFGSGPEGLQIRRNSGHDRLRLMVRHDNGKRYRHCR